MNNENTNSQTTEQQASKAPVVGGKRQPSFAEAIFGVTAEPKREEANQVPEEGAEPPSGGAADTLLGESSFSTEIEGDPQPAVSEEELTEEEYYEFGNQKYTPAELEEVLRERETYQRYNQSVKPLADSVTEYSTQFERSRVLATTECEKTIAELKRAINSGQLDSRQYQAAHQQLMGAEARMIQLDQAAREESELRAKALTQVRQQNARQSVATLTKQGWTRDDILSVGGIAQQVIGDKLGDVMSPELMQVFRDAAELRRAKEGAAKRLQAKTKTALKTTKQAPQKQQPQQPAGNKSWGEMIFGGNK